LLLGQVEATRMEIATLRSQWVAVTATLRSQWEGVTARQEN